MRAQGFSLTKAHGQHLLKNPLVIQTIIEKAEIRPTDTIIEIGPGTGNLTVKLLERAAKVIVFEIDRRMIAELRKRIVTHFPQLNHKLHIIAGDFLRADLPRFDMCVSNCPYNISSGIVFKLLRQTPAPRRHVLMFQREFALGLCARPGEPDYSRITVNTQLLARATHAMKISRNSFRPPPKVDSSVVILEPLPAHGVDLDEWEGLIRITFSRKNRTLRAIFAQKKTAQMLMQNYNALAAADGRPQLALAETRERLEAVVREQGALEKRSAKMRVADMINLLNAFVAAGFRFSS